MPSIPSQIKTLGVYFKHLLQIFDQKWMCTDNSLTSLMAFSVKFEARPKISVEGLKTDEVQDVVRFMMDFSGLCDAEERQSLVLYMLTTPVFELKS